MRILLFGLAMLVLAGCGARPQVQKEAPSPNVSADTSEAYQRAMRHVVDASIYEVKGEFANAILEWQDALRTTKDDAIYYALARDYSILKKHPQAIEAAREAVRLRPEKNEYRRALGDILIAAFQYDEAIKEFQEIIRRDSSDNEAWFAVARLQQGKDPQASLAAYEQILARFGPAWEVLAQTADVYSRMGKFDKAAEKMQQMTELDPTNRQLGLTLAQTYVRAEKYDLALAEYAKVTDLTPANADLEIEIAGIYLLKKDYAGARRRFNAILARDSVGLDARIHCGDLYYGAVEKDSTLAPEAISIFRVIGRDYPNDWRPNWFLGLLGSTIHDDTLTVNNFRSMTAKAPRNPDGWVSLASTYLGKNDFSRVVALLEPVAPQFGDDFRVLFLLGIAYNRLARNEESIHVLEKARSLNPRNIDVITQLALVYDGMKQFDESDSLYEMALRLDPGNHLALNNYSYSLAERNLQLDRALAMSRKAVDAQPDNASYLDTIGWIYFRFGKYDKALEYVNRAVAKGEASAVVIEHLGDIYFKLGDKPHAMEQWKKALDLDAGNASLKQKLERGTL
jgi:tetratricopeptide (TPR) repeat protein